MRCVHTRYERTTSTTRNHVQYPLQRRSSKSRHNMIDRRICMYTVYYILNAGQKKKKKTKQTSYEKRMGCRKRNKEILLK